MTSDPNIRSLIARLGQSQDERLPAELDEHYIDVDERTPADLRAYTAALAAKLIPFVRASGDLLPAGHDQGGWRALFGSGAAHSQPARALFEAFISLYEFPRQEINRLTGRHLDFFYEQLLGFERQHATPDRAHVILGLKKGAAPVRVTPAHLFSAGKDTTGAEVLYSPTAETIVNAGQVASLRSIFVEHDRPGHVRCAPIANSSDGLGEPLTEEAPSWRPFGHAALPVADVGFAIASPILRLKEGQRTIKAALTVHQPLPDLAGAFQALLTGEKQWLGPYPVMATSGAGVLNLQVDVPADDPAIVNSNPQLHGVSYGSDAPVMEILLASDSSAAGYDDLRGLRVDTISLSVDVTGLTTLGLESDAGSLDAKKAFLPFGAEAQAGSRLMIGCEEALSKKLSRLDVTLEWKGAPMSLPYHYTGYTPGITSNSAFTVFATFHDRSAAHTRAGVPLFDAQNAGGRTVLSIIGASAPAKQPPHFGDYVFALNQSGTRWSRLQAQKAAILRPAISTFLSRRPNARSGFIVLALESGFLHAEYRRQSIEKVIAKITTPATALLNEPYTPTLQHLSLSYTAHTDTVRVSSPAADDFAQPDVQFYAVGPFGQMRDHGHLRSALAFVSDRQVPLVPEFADGELLIGLVGVAGGDSVSLLLQVADGSANPDVVLEAPEWSVLCDNYWRRLSRSEIARDTTNRLLRSGVVALALPTEASTEHTILPAGMVWVKAASARDPQYASRLLDVRANAVEVQFVMASEDAAAAHLTTATKAGAIAKLKTPIPTVSVVRQPYASFNGAPRESSQALRVRAAERLRHKGRAITPWDFERLVLGAFPSVHTVKCIPHAKPGSWTAAGHVLVVVVPDARGQSGPPTLQPKCDADTIARIETYLRARTTAPASVAVKNPTYQRVRFACRVRFHDGFEFNFYRGLVQEALTRALSPWAFDDEGAVAFGGRVYRSALLNVVESLPYVDYVTDFQMFTFIDESARRQDVDVAEPLRPDAILVSDEGHDVREAV